jgi:hypothetical protein
MTGCVHVVKLTSEEQNLISEYSSYVLVKHSRYNNTLLLSKDELAKAEKKKAEEESKAAERRASREAGQSSGGSSQESKGEGGEGGSGAVVPSNSAISMTEAIGINGLDFAFTGYEVMDYIQGAYFSVNASPGKQLVIMNFTITNTTGNSITCDLRSGKYKFKGSFNGKSIVAMSTAFLPNDIASFDKNTAFGAGQKTNCILVFDVPKEVSGSLSEVTLSVTKDGMTGYTPIKS